MLPDLMNLHDVRVLQLGDRLGLSLEASQVPGAGVGAGQDHLEGDEALEAALPGLVDNAHSAAPQLRQQFVVSEGADLAAHGWGCRCGKDGDPGGASSSGA